MSAAELGRYEQSILDALACESENIKAILDGMEGKILAKREEAMAEKAVDLLDEMLEKQLREAERSGKPYGRMMEVRGYIACWRLRRRPRPRRGEEIGEID